MAVLSNSPSSQNANSLLANLSENGCLVLANSTLGFIRYESDTDVTFGYVAVRAYAIDNEIDHEVANQVVGVAERGVSVKEAEQTVITADGEKHVKAANSVVGGVLLAVDGSEVYFFEVHKLAAVVAIVEKKVTSIT